MAGWRNVVERGEERVQSGAGERIGGDDKDAQYVRSLSHGRTPGVSAGVYGLAHRFTRNPMVQRGRAPASKHCPLYRCECETN